MKLPLERPSLSLGGRGCVLSQHKKSEGREFRKEHGRALDPAVRKHVLTVSGCVRRACALGVRVQSVCIGCVLRACALGVRAQVCALGVHAQSVCIGCACTECVHRVCVRRACGLGRGVYNTGLGCRAGSALGGPAGCLGSPEDILGYSGEVSWRKRDPSSWPLGKGRTWPRCELRSQVCPWEGLPPQPGGSMAVAVLVEQNFLIPASQRQVAPSE